MLDGLSLLRARQPSADGDRRHSTPLLGCNCGKATGILPAIPHAAASGRGDLRRADAPSAAHSGGRCSETQVWSRHNTCIGHHMPQWSVLAAPAPDGQIDQRVVTGSALYGDTPRSDPSQSCSCGRALEILAGSCSHAASGRSDNRPESPAPAPLCGADCPTHRCDQLRESQVQSRHSKCTCSHHSALWSHGGVWHGNASLFCRQPDGTPPGLLPCVLQVPVGYVPGACGCLRVPIPFSSLETPGQKHTVPEAGHLRAHDTRACSARRRSHLCARRGTCAQERSGTHGSVGLDIAVGCSPGIEPDTAHAFRSFSESQHSSLSVCPAHALCSFIPSYVSAGAA